MIWNYLTIAGFCLELVGVIMMANRFRGVDLVSLLIALFLSPLSSKFTSTVARISQGEKDHAYGVLRGLGFLAWGFTMQFVAFVATLQS